MASMSRAHFNAIADSLRNSKPDEDDSEPGHYDGELYVWETVVLGLCRKLAQFNPGFDEARFKQACGLHQ